MGHGAGGYGRTDKSKIDNEARSRAQAIGSPSLVDALKAKGGEGEAEKEKGTDQY